MSEKKEEREKEKERNSWRKLFLEPKDFFRSRVRPELNCLTWGCPKPVDPAPPKEAPNAGGSPDVLNALDRPGKLSVPNRPLGLQLPSNHVRRVGRRLRDDSRACPGEEFAPHGGFPVLVAKQSGDLFVRVELHACVWDNSSKTCEIATIEPRDKAFCSERGGHTVPNSFEFCTTRQSCLGDVKRVSEGDNRGT